LLRKGLRGRGALAPGRSRALFGLKIHRNQRYHTKAQNEIFILCFGKADWPPRLMARKPAWRLNAQWSFF